MLNQTVLVGRITKDVEIKKIEDRKYAILKLAVTRSFKNEEGTYDTDFIDVSIFDNIADNVKEYCKVGDLVGIKGRLESKEDKLILVGEKVTFLSQAKKGEE